VGAITATPAVPAFAAPAGSDGTAAAPQAVAITTTTTTTTVVVTTTTIPVTTTTATANPTTTASSVMPIMSLSATTVTPGETVSCSTSQWPAGASVSAELHSTPIALGTVTADASGSATANFTVPANLSLGQHQVTLTGVDFAGETVTIAETLNVVAAGVSQATSGATVAATGSLPATGSSDATALAEIGFSLLGLGALAVALSRRRAAASRIGRS
jgi:LPXTG-motif cell wall-anchored protein